MGKLIFVPCFHTGRNDGRRDFSYQKRTNALFASGYQEYEGKYRYVGTYML